MSQVREDPYGIKAGVNNFLQSFMAMSQYKQQQKLMKNKPILDLIQQQIASDDITFDEKQRLIDSVPNLLGIKLKGGVPLSQQLGLHIVNERVIKTGEKDVTKQTPPTPEKSIADTDLQTILSGQAGKVTSNAPVNTKEDVLTRRGDMTPFEVKLLKLKDNAKMQSDLDIDKATKLAELNNQDFKATQYLYDDKDKLFLQMINQKGTVKIVDALTGKEGTPEGNLRTERTVNKQLTGKQLSATFRETKANLLNKINPATGQKYTDEEAEEEALDIIANNRAAFARGQSIRTESASRTMPNEEGITPQQEITNSREQERLNLERENKLNNLQGEVEKQQRIIKDSTHTLTQKLARQAEIEGKLNGYKLYPPDKEDKPEEYADYQRTLKEHKDLMEDIDTLQKSITYSQADLDKAKTQLANTRNSYGVKEDSNGFINNITPSSSNSKKYTTAQQNKINAVRLANKEATKNMTDDDIANYIISSGKSF